jgi:hypothetical protein
MSELPFYVSFKLNIVMWMVQKQDKPGKMRHGKYQPEIQR